MAAAALTAHGHHEEEAEQRHEDARHQLDDERVDPEVHLAQSGVDGRRVGLVRRRHDVVHRLVGGRVPTAGDSQRHVVGDQYDGARRTDQQHDEPARPQVVSGRRVGGRASSVSSAPHHRVAEHRQGDGDPDGSGVRRDRQVGVDDAEPSGGERVTLNGPFEAVQAVELGLDHRHDAS